MRRPGEGTKVEPAILKSELVPDCMKAGLGMMLPAAPGLPAVFSVCDQSWDSFLTQAFAPPASPNFCVVS